LRRAPGDLGPDLREPNPALAPLDKLGAQLPFEIADLHRKRRLAYRAFLRGPTEMLVSGERVKVAKLA